MLRLLSLLCFPVCFGLGCADAAAQGAAGLGSRTEMDRPVLLDVVGQGRGGVPRPGGEQFVVTDNGRRVPGAQVQVLGGDGIDGGAAGGSGGRVRQLVFVVDALNSSEGEVARSEEALTAFLTGGGGRLVRPATILIVSDAAAGGEKRARADSTTALRPRELFVHRIAASLDGNALARDLASYRTGLHRISDAQAGVGSGERVRLSLQALSFIATAEAAEPGAKVVVWIGPGWPYLAASEARSSAEMFASVIYFSDLLRTARMILYSVDPRGMSSCDQSGVQEGFLLASRAGSIQAAGRAPNVPTVIGDDYYKNFLRGVRQEKESNPNDLSLQVLAMQSGGLVLQQNNDLKAQIARCAGEVETLRTLAYTPAPGSGGAYHEIRVTEIGSSAGVRTRAGFYVRGTAGDAVRR